MMPVPHTGQAFPKMLSSAGRLSSLGASGEEVPVTASDKGLYTFQTEKGVEYHVILKN